MQISSGVSNTCLFATAPYYKLNKGFFISFLFKTARWATPTSRFKQESLGKVSFIYYLLACKLIDKVDYKNYQPMKILLVITCI